MKTPGSSFENSNSIFFLGQITQLSQCLSCLGAYMGTSDFNGGGNPVMD